MTHASTIHRWLQEEKHFLGCFKSSKLPKFPSSFPKSLIINIDEDANIGHFVALLLQDTYVIYFDPLGLRPPLNENIKYYLKSVYLNVRFYSCLFPLQHDFSVKCGEFCSIFILRVKNVNNFKTYLNIFHKSNLWRNDVIVDFLFNMTHCPPLLK